MKLPAVFSGFFRKKELRPVDGHWTTILDRWMGAWQQHVITDADSTENLLLHSAVFACVTLIAGDFAKLRPRLVRFEEQGYAKELVNSAWNPLLRKPNPYQTRAQFIEHWLYSRLLHGNTYVLKERDKRGVVNRLYILDPSRVTPLVADNGDVFYRLRTDNLAAIEEEVIVPASEMIHDRWNTFWHPLVGVSPLTAAAWSATTGNKISKNSSNFFGNMSRPGGILSAPGEISDDTARRLKEYWDSTYGGSGAGSLAVVGDALTYQPVSMSATDAQLTEQLNWTAADIARAFKIPPFMIGAGPLPGLNNTETLIQLYYSQCLQTIIEGVENVLDEGLELPLDTHMDFDLADLMRMDTATRYKSYTDAISGGWMAPNEARRRESLEPVQGGDTPYLQQQNYSLAALDKRDQLNPLADPGPNPTGTENVPAEPTDDELAAQEMMLGAFLTKEFA